MTLNLTIPPNPHTDFTPRITVIGVGGGGTNAVGNMIAMNLTGVEFVVANTDAQQLLHSAATRRIQLGPHITQGLGAGAKPEIGRAAAEEAADELYRYLEGTHMVFITAGMGGGTGTGAAPVIARMAREKNILTVGVVTKPFTFEGQRRARTADEGIAELQQAVDTLIVIPNQNLFRLANERTGWREAFKMADNVLYMGVRSVTDLMVAPGLVNLDFADIRTVMAEMGKAMMGTGEAEGENRSIKAAEAAISNPLLEDTSMAGARGLLINITGGEDMTLFEVDQAANRIREEVDEEANIIFGSAIDETLNGRIRVSVVATGIDTPMERTMERPRLVAMGGGAAPADIDATAEAVEAPKSLGPTPPMGIRPAAPASVLPQARQQTARAPAVGIPVPHLVPSAPLPSSASAAQTAEAGYPGAAGLTDEQAEPPAASRTPPRPGARTPAQPPRGNGMPGGGQGFAAAVQPPRRSIFTIVTGALRGSLPAAPVSMPAQPARAEPSLHDTPREAEAQANVHQTASDEMGIDIPAFLRRQSSWPGTPSA
jgi:cell division protein FtsZ